jgi:uncharacterized protein YicC (UPF0701 family)
MIKSLTGFGNVDINDESNQLNIIIRTVNSRFLDIKIRGIDLNPKLEMNIRKDIQKSLQRGNVQIQINHRNGTNNNKKIKFNRERYEQIENIIYTVQKDYGRHLQLSDIISLTDLTVGSDSVEIDDSIILKGVSDAIKQVNGMRKEEGTLISGDIKNRILIDLKVDEDRLAQEIAINVDRFDFTEEIVRAASHCEQFISFLKVDEPVGKKLNFILQELSREVNTIGSKSPSTEVSQIVVELKSEIEKIREQVQNIL